MIIYLHGLNSAGMSAKAAWLRERLSPITVLSPTYPAHLADEAVAMLRDFIAHSRSARPAERKLLLIGSSLGGLYASYLAPELGAGIVLINPSARPDETLARYVGPQRNDATGEEYVLTEAAVKAFGNYRLPRCRPEVPTLLLLDEADEVIDYRVAEKFYRGCGRTIVYPGGSHRFDHLAEALPEIRRMYDRV